MCVGVGVDGIGVGVDIGVGGVGGGLTAGGVGAIADGGEGLDSRGCLVWLMLGIDGSSRRQ